MSSISSRFSSMSSSANKSFLPPKPNYNSPKLVQEAKLAPAASFDQPKVAHPFASSSYAVKEASPTQPTASRNQSRSRYQDQASGLYAGEFESLQDGISDDAVVHGQQHEHGFGSSASNISDFDNVGRARSNTVGSQPYDIAGGMSPMRDFLPSPNPFESQFDDDSEDEERLDIASRTLSGVPHRARLAAIGTASRLFKGRRHSRTSSSSQTPPFHAQDLPGPLKIDKRSSKQRDAPSSRPSTSDGMSPLPRQAVFGHRPSPSELTIPKSDKTRSVTPADRDLILALQGGATKPRSKPSDKKKLLPKQSGHDRHSSVQHTSPLAEKRGQWIAPPPYCVSENADLTRRESLRKSQSLSTLRFDPNRRPSKQLSPAVEADAKASSDKENIPHHVEQSVWEAMVNSSPQTINDDSSISSCGPVTRTEVITDSPRRLTPKGQRLPPQKPPPQSCPPPPPPNFTVPGMQSIGSAKSSLEVDSSSSGSAFSSVDAGSMKMKGSANAPTRMLPPLPAIPNASPRSRTISASPTRSISNDSNVPQESPSTQLPFRHDQPDRQVELNVGGTKFVTLASTLKGVTGDQPQLLELLQNQAEATRPDSAQPLTQDTHLLRQKRFDITHRGTRERAGTESSLYAAVLGACGVVNEEAAAESSPDEADHVPSVCGSVALQPSESQSSSSSLATTASEVPSLAESNASTSRTSDVSDALWSKEDISTAASQQKAGKTEAMPSDAISNAAHLDTLPAQNSPNKNDWFSTALPSSRLGSPQVYSSSTFASAPVSSNSAPILSSGAPTSIFLDRNGDVYHDILDVLRTRKLPYRLQAASIVATPCHSNASNSTAISCSNDRRCALTALRLQLRCRLHEVQDEAEWLGYHSIVKLCEQEFSLLVN